MSIESTLLARVPWFRYWPCAAAGFLMPSLTLFLTRWLRPYGAAGIAGFISGVFLMAMLSRYFPPKRRVPVWVAALVCGSATGVVSGVMAYLLGWP